MPSILTADGIDDLFRGPVVSVNDVAQLVEVRLALLAGEVTYSATRPPHLDRGELGHQDSRSFRDSHAYP